MARVDLHQVLRDTVEVRPEIRRHRWWIALTIVALVVVSAIEYPLGLLAAVAVAVTLALLIRFAYCYVRARDAAPV